MITGLFPVVKDFCLTLDSNVSLRELVAYFSTLLTPASSVQMWVPLSKLLAVHSTHRFPTKCFQLRFGRTLRRHSKGTTSYFPFSAAQQLIIYWWGGGCVPTTITCYGCPFFWIWTRKCFSLVNCVGKKNEKWTNVRNVTTIKVSLSCVLSFVFVIKDSFDYDSPILVLYLCFYTRRDIFH